jgi:hypothetical protein
MQTSVSQVAPRSSAQVPQAAAAKPGLLDQVPLALRAGHYSRRTEQTYCLWIKGFILFHNKRHPAEMRELEINAFLTHLAVKEHVSASTQHQALSALLFLFGMGLAIHLSTSQAMGKWENRRAGSSPRRRIHSPESDQGGRA